MPYFPDHIPDNGDIGGWVTYIIWTVFVALVAACVGSFINVVVARLPQGESIAFPGSHCPRCSRPIAWYDNIPVLSFILLGGKCRGCRAAISWRYPVVETVACVLGLALWLSKGPGATFVFEAAILGLLLTLALIDAQTFLLPHQLTISLALVSLLSRFVAPLIDDGATLQESAANVLGGVLGGVAGALLLGFVAVVGTYVARRTGRIGPDEDAMGFGDIVLIAGIGIISGLFGVVVVIFLASIQGAIIGGLHNLFSAESEMDPEVTASEESGSEPPGGEDQESDEDWEPPHKAIPFGPFLALAAMEWIFLGARIEPLIKRLFVF